MSLRETALLTAIVINATPVVAAYVRHRSGLAWWATAAAAISMSAFLGILWRLVSLGPDPGSGPWVLVLVAAGFPVLLSGFIFTGLLGREDPGLALRYMARPFSVVVGFGTLALIFLNHPAFVREYVWSGGVGEIVLGPAGKTYISFLLVGAVLVGFNLESAFRLARGPARERLQPVLLGHFGVLGFLAYVLTTALVYGSVDLDNLVALVLPLSVASFLTGYRFVNGTLADTTVPVSRNVVYSSFTALVAALYFLAMGSAAQLATLTGWKPGHVVTASFVFLVIIVAFLFFFSGGFKRTVRRFIDRNFYVNRYDYRHHWARATEVLEPSQTLPQLLGATEDLLTDLFLADQVSIALKDKGGHQYRVRQGRGAGDSRAVLDTESPLVARLYEEPRGFAMPSPGKDRHADQIRKQNPDWVESTACGALAPMFNGAELVGVVGLERNHAGDQFTYEDLELLDCTLAQVTAVLRGAQLGNELADAREMELLSQWSNMLVHDFKNYLSPLRLIIQNMRVHIGNTEFQKDAVEDLAGVTGRMEGLVRRLSELRKGFPLDHSVVTVDRLVGESLAGLKLDKRVGLKVRSNLVAGAGVRGDAEMLRRVVENLLTNAVEAMEGKGTLTITTRLVTSGHAGETDLLLMVEDTGAGMDEAFISDRLFRPFITTKKKGLGLGLYQCRSIVEAHGGEIHAESRRGEGTTFKVILPAVAALGRRADPDEMDGNGSMQWKSQPK